MILSPGLGAMRIGSGRVPNVLLSIPVDGKRVDEGFFSTYVKLKVVGRRSKQVYPRKEHDVWSGFEAAPGRVRGKNPDWSASKSAHLPSHPSSVPADSEKRQTRGRPLVHNGAEGVLVVVCMS